MTDDRKGNMTGSFPKNIFVVVPYQINSNQLMSVMDDNSSLLSQIKDSSLC